MHFNQFFYPSNMEFCTFSILRLHTSGFQQNGQGIGNNTLSRPAADDKWEVNDPRKIAF